MSDLKQKLTNHMKEAMRAKDKTRLLTVRTILANIKQVEVDTRESLNDAEIISVLDKMRKQRNESIAQFEKAGRDDLIIVEQNELKIIEQYLPTPLSEDEITGLVKKAISTTNAELSLIHI